VLSIREQIVEFCVEVEDGTIGGRVLGNAKGRPVLFLHGGPGDTCAYMERMAAPFLSNIKGIFFDQRGTGRSASFPLEPQIFTIPKMLGDVQSVLTHFHLNNETKDAQATLVGHSWGGMYGLYAASQFEELFRNVILLNMGPLDSTAAQEFQESLLGALSKAEQLEWTALRAKRKTALEEGRDADVKVADRDLMKLRSKVWIFHPHKREPFLEDYFLDPPPNRRVNNLVWEQAMAWFRWESLRIPKCTLHVVDGEADRMPRSQRENLLAWASHTKFHTLERCGHVPWIDEPKQFEELLSKLLSM
jgi:proline iminopeptidase